MSDVTQILHRLERGETHAAEELLPLVYEELRKLAAARMAAAPAGQTLQATALVHEAYLRIVGSGPDRWNGRGHFFSAAAEAMRRILIDRARQKASLRHGGNYRRLSLEDVDLATETDSNTLLALDEALDQYAQRDPTGAQLIKLRFYVGLPNHEAAAILGLSERTAKRTWAFARAWLYEEIRQRQ